MGLWKNFKKRLGYSTQKRAYHAAKVSRLNTDWVTGATSANSEIKGSLKALRARARQLERDNDYARRYFKALENNVLGSNGVQLQAKAKDIDGTSDTFANNAIERAWKKWGRMGNCTVTGKHSWHDVQRVVLRSVARDGSVLVRKVRGYDNAFRYALQILEADLLAHDMNGMDKKTGNSIRMGVEQDKWEKPVAYHLHSSHEGDDFPLSDSRKTERVPADEILHVYMSERPHQATGVPWLCSAMSRLNQLSAYEEAELISARIGASKMGFYVKGEGGEGYQGEEDASGNLITEAEPGSFEQLPAGLDFKTFDPQHPTGNYQHFIKACLRGVASGLGISYNSLASDLEGVNYSSIRAGLLEEREEWQSIQRWFITHLLDEVYADWLNYALLSGELQLPAGKYSKFRSVEWKARRWPWVDPLKDAQANILQISNGLKSRRQIVSEAGGDIEDTYNQIADDVALAEGKGISVDAGLRPDGFEAVDNDPE